MPEAKERFLVTSALPYANGPVHIGHAVGAYLPADIFVRYRRARGDDVVFVCGTDEHGTPISVAADAEKVSPREIVEKYHKIQADAFAKLGVAFDNFSGTARPHHHKLSQEFFTTIYKKGFIYEKTVLRPYCGSCKRFLPDRYVKGVCPNCKSEEQRGDQCEKCGKQLEPDELLEPYCIICRNKPVMRETKHWFFKLSEFSEPLRRWIEGNGHWPENARKFALGWIREGLLDRAITRDLSWGIPVPLKEAEGKVLYVWFDAPIGYISSTMEWAEKVGKPNEWRKYWTKPTRIIHFIGKDNIPFHTIIWPATLIAEGSYSLPWQIASNEFLNLEGQKVSTSRGWVIWLHDILSEFDADAVRYYLISIAPETHDSDFNLGEFQEKVNKELIGTFGNFINRSLTFIEKNGGVVPEPKGFDGEDNALIEVMRKAPGEIGGFLEKLSAKNALAALLTVSQRGNEYFQHKEPWKSENATTLYVCANLVRTLSVLSHPFLPHSAQKIWAMLGEKGDIKSEKWACAGELKVEAGRKLGKIGVLYKKIEDDKIGDFKEKYLHTKKDGREESRMPEVDYTEFQKMDLRVGVVKSAEDHPNANKLVVLKVDLGDLGERQIVAGVRDNYGKDELSGRQIIVIINLKPAKIRGVESQGMLLAAVDDEGKAILLMPDKKAKAGSKIK